MDETVKKPRKKRTRKPKAKPAVEETVKVEEPKVVSPDPIEPEALKVEEAVTASKVAPPRPKGRAGLKKVRAVKSFRARYGRVFVDMKSGDTAEFEEEISNWLCKSGRCV